MDKARGDAKARLWLALGALAGLALLAGCVEGNHALATVASRSRPFQEYLQDPVTLTTVKTVAVLPFDHAGGEAGGFDADAFAVKLANHLASTGQYRVIYPREVLGDTARRNEHARLYNAYLRDKERFAGVGASQPARPEEDEFGPVPGAAVAEARPAPADYRPYADPTRNVDEAVRLARRVKADAVLVGTVTDVDPYMRPRVSFTMRLVATGQSASAAAAVAEMTQWGVPRDHADARGEVYVRQQTYDSREGNVGFDVSAYARTHHTDNHPNGSEAYLRSLDLYYDVAADHLAKVMAEAKKAAVKEAERRAKEAAKRRGENPDRARANLFARLARDGDIPDVETAALTPDYWDRRFPEAREALAGAGDTRVRSWRPEGTDLRRADPIERDRRDRRIPENDRAPAWRGATPESEAGFPDPDEVLASSLRDHRDSAWRPDRYNRAHPEKAAALYAPEQRRADGY